MVGHEGGLPHLYLGIIAVDLGQLLGDDGASEGALDKMGEVGAITGCADVTLQLPEEGTTPFDAERNHIQPHPTIILPISTAVLVVLSIMERYPPTL